jgi:hypothetical protein
MQKKKETAIGKTTYFAIKHLIFSKNGKMGKT